MSTPDLRYPIGKFSPPASITHQDLDEAILKIETLPQELRAAVSNLGEDQILTPYRPEGWTVGQVVHHFADSHMNSYVRFKLALTESTPTIKPYDEAAWAKLPDAQNTKLEPSLILLEGLHTRWSQLLRSLTPGDFERAFLHPEHPGRPLTIAWATLLYGWHSRHHLEQILSLKSRKGW